MSTIAASKNESKKKTNKIIESQHENEVYETGRGETSRTSRLRGGEMVFILIGIALFKSILIPSTFFLARRLLDPLYANTSCLLNLVNVTAPQHYASHPFWHRYGGGRQ